MAHLAARFHDNAHLSFYKLAHSWRWLSRAMIVVLITMAVAPATAQEQASSPKEALLGADVCSDTWGKRTQTMQIDNQTNWTVEIAFFQGKDESALVPSGFITNTGVFVAGVNQPGPSVVIADPCYAGGSRRPIQATRALASLLLVDPATGTEFPLNLPDMNGDVTSYWVNAVWQVVFSPIRGADGKRIIEARLLKKKNKQ